jgi:murein DD-endopeptidase MepM/ murein hydrolase activator NlpD
MKIWPVPESYEKKVPKNGDPGSFWEDRGDRRHCGIDIYAPEGSEVLSIEGGRIIDIGVFTSPEMHHYWNKTYYIILKSPKNILFKYAELGEVLVYVGDQIEAGHLLGNIGQVINGEDVDYTDPYYVRELADKGRLSMLHLELYKAPVTQVQPYLAGNFFGVRLPESLIDPAYYLNGIAKQQYSFIRP